MLNLILLFCFFNLGFFWFTYTLLVLSVLALYYYISLINILYLELLVDYYYTHFDTSYYWFVGVYEYILVIFFPLLLASA